MATTIKIKGAKVAFDNTHKKDKFGKYSLVVSIPDKDQAKAIIDAATALEKETGLTFKSDILKKYTPEEGTPVLQLSASNTKPIPVAIMEVNPDDGVKTAVPFTDDIGYDSIVNLAISLYAYDNEFGKGLGKSWDSVLITDLATAGTSPDDLLEI